MCDIVDANQVSAFFQEPASETYAPVVRWINFRGGCIVYGGKVKSELDRIKQAAQRVQEWSRSGRAIRVEDEQLMHEEQAVHQQHLCRSNDGHVIALARVSGARVLCTQDRDLMYDFGNQRLITRPRGKIYRGPEHARLLRHYPCCGVKPSERKRRR